MAHRLPLKDHIFISEFAAYARGRGEVEYIYSAPCGCALAQFLKDTGRAKGPFVGAFHWEDDRGREHWFNPDDRLAWSPLAAAIKAEPHNFASLATRLESLLSDMRVGVDHG